jgi:hypothetical protein
METAITESFMKSIQAAVDQCMEKVKEESRIFANALKAVRHLPSATTPVATPVVDTGHLEHRIAALELAYQRQVQKTIAGLSEDIGDLDGRLAAIERTNRPDAEDVAAWDKGPSAWSWPGPSKKNEVVVDDRTTVCDFGLGDVLVNVNHVEDDVEMLPAPAPAPAPVTSPVPATPAKKPEPEPEPEEEESEPLELEELEYEGVTYYKDPDNNVYKPNDDGEVDAESPVGRWLEKKQTLKLY